MACDWGIGSRCATLSRLDITHNIQPFITWQQAGYNHPAFGGCAWFANKLATALDPMATNNPVQRRHRRSKIQYWTCMQQACGCTSSGIIWGCMDDGNMDNSYMNNRGTWNFQLMNNTTSSGVVSRIDGTGLTGLQTGSAFPGVPAMNLYLGATGDDGSCIYPLETSPGALDGLPYWKWGCMNNTSHIYGTSPTGNSLHPAGYPDINGHGTAAVYDCPNNQTVPTTPDPCIFPCGGLGGNTGYFVQNYDPCANFSCNTGASGPPPSGGTQIAYASDMSARYTEWKDGPGFGQNVFRPFGAEICCIQPPPSPINPGITYDFRLASAWTSGGISFTTADTIGAQGPVWSGPQTEDHIGKPYLRITMNRFDVVGNEMFASIKDGERMWAYGTHTNIPQASFKEINIKIYDIHKVLIADYDYVFTHGTSATPSWAVTDPCYIILPRLTLVQQNFPVPQIGVPSPPVDLNPHNSQAFNQWAFNATNQFTQIQAGQKPVGYVQINHDVIMPAGSGTTVDTGNTFTCPQPGWPSNAQCAPRIGSSHWVTTRGNTSNLANHWTGNDLDFDAVNNAYPNWQFGQGTPGLINSGVGAEYPHSCNCCMSTPNIHLHWLEPGPNDPTPGNYYYNNPNYTGGSLGSPLNGPTNVYPNFSQAQGDINGSCHNMWSSTPIIGPGGNLKLSPPSQTSGQITKFTYSFNKNQEVTTTRTSTQT